MAMLKGAIESEREQMMARQMRGTGDEGGPHNILCDLGNRWGGWGLELAGSRGCRSFLLPWLVAVFLRANTLGVGKRCVIYKFMSEFWSGLWWWVTPLFSG